MHRYPRASALTAAVGGHGIAVLHALIRRADTIDGCLVASVSLRDLCVDVPASKDTIGRRLDQLARTGIIEVVPHRNGTAMEYDLQVERLRAAACSLAGRDLTREEWTQYVGADAPRRSRCS